MGVLLIFVVGLVSVLLLGFLGRFAAGYLVATEVAPVAGFAFAIGAVFAGGFQGIVPDGETQRIVLYLGMILGLTSVWYLFFKRLEIHG